MSDFIFSGQTGQQNNALNPNHVSILKSQFCRLFYNIQAGQIRIVDIYTISDKLNLMAWKVRPLSIDWKDRLKSENAREKNCVNFYLKNAD